MMNFRRRLIFSCIALLLLVFTVAVALEYIHERHYKIDLLSTQLEAYTDLIGQSLHTTPAAPPHLVYRYLPPDLRLTLIDSQGKVLYENTDAPRVKSVNHLHRAEVAGAHSPTGEGYDIRESATLGIPFFYYAKRYGNVVVRVALPYDRQLKSNLRVDSVFLWFLLVLFSLCVIGIFYITDRFGRSVMVLQEFVQSAERGLISYKGLVYPSTLLSQLGATILHRYEELEQSKKQIAEERERLLAHFLHLSAGIALYTSDNQQIYANQFYHQFYHQLDIERRHHNGIEQGTQHPVAQFLDEAKTSEQQVVRKSVHVGSVHFVLQYLQFDDTSYELLIMEETEKERMRQIKEEMSHNVAHELRTPVSSVRGYVESLLLHPEWDENVKQTCLQRALVQCDRLTALIKDISTIAQLEQTEAQWPQSSVDLLPLVERLHHEWSEKLAQVAMTWRIVGIHGVKIWANESLMYSIFQNLLENAYRYAGRETDIVFELVELADEYVVFRFYDTGQGVAEEALPHLFDRFYRTDKGRSREQGGTGLGLSIVKHAIQSQGGEISVSCGKEGGLSYVFCLLRCEAHQDDVAERA